MKYIEQKEKGARLALLYLLRRSYNYMEPRTVRAMRFVKRPMPFAILSLMVVLAIIVRFGFDTAPAGGQYTEAPDAYLNSSECDGTDPDVVLCEDFERQTDGSTPGTWWTENCDDSSNAGPTSNPLQEKGWCGNIFTTPNPVGAVDCGAPTHGGFGQCVAHAGIFDGQTGDKMSAMHNLGPSDDEYNEVYVRYYLWHSVGYIYSSTKLLTFNRCCNPGGIYWGNMGTNVGFGENSLTQSNVQFTNNLLDQTGIPGNTTIWNCNIGGGCSLFSAQGHWLFIEAHMKLNTPPFNSDGVLELWFQDCGATLPGTCTGSPTKRMEHTNVPWGKTTGEAPGVNGQGMIGNLWWEHWSNPGTTGIVKYDQFKVSTSGPIGFFIPN